MERKYTESEIREALVRASEKQCVGFCNVDDVWRALRGPRLKPDCHVEDVDGIGWDDQAQAEANGAGPPFIPLIRADRVMEWVERFATKYIGDAHVAKMFFAKRIREETEVSDE